MLTAHANTTADDFIAQLRTYVIAMGLSTAVVDCVDNLTGADCFDAESVAEGASNMKTEILEAVETWCNEQFKFPEALKTSLIAAIKGVEV